uniref:SHSP domain-containing protein n=1 Tax=Panagrolaimus sp. JU765 TaxID=591449 RepID=A0AC34RPW9_9BILA
MEEYLHDMIKIAMEAKRLNLTTMGDVITDNISWKNYTFGPFQELSRTEAYKHFFGDYSVNATSFNYSVDIHGLFKPEEFKIEMNGTILEMTGEHVEKMGKVGKSTAYFHRSVPLPEDFTMKDIKYEFDHERLYVCGDLRYKCQINHPKSKETPTETVRAMMALPMRLSREYLSDTEFVDLDQ